MGKAGAERDGSKALVTDPGRPLLGTMVPWKGRVGRSTTQPADPPEERVWRRPRGPTAVPEPCSVAPKASPWLLPWWAGAVSPPRSLLTQLAAPTVSNSPVKASHKPECLSPSCLKAWKESQAAGLCPTRSSGDSSRGAGPLGPLCKSLGLRFLRYVPDKGLSDSYLCL